MKKREKKPKIIIVTGTPGTGKTTVAKHLANSCKATYIDVNRIIKKHHLKEGYDKKRKTFLVDTKKLNKIFITMIKETKNSLVIDSHLSHYMPSKYVDLCIVTKTSLKKLKDRLKKRGYHKEKIHENLLCEIFDVCLTEAQERGHKVQIIKT